MHEFEKGVKTIVSEISFCFDYKFLVPYLGICLFMKEIQILFLTKSSKLWPNRMACTYVHCACLIKVIFSAKNLMKQWVEGEGVGILFPTLSCMICPETPEDGIGPTVFCCNRALGRSENQGAQCFELILRWQFVYI